MDIFGPQSCSLTEVDAQIVRSPVFYLEFHAVSFWTVRTEVRKSDAFRPLMGYSSFPPRTENARAESRSSLKRPSNRRVSAAKQRDKRLCARISPLLDHRTGHSVVRHDDDAL